MCSSRQCTEIKRLATFNQMCKEKMLNFILFLVYFIFLLESNLFTGGTRHKSGNTTFWFNLRENEICVAVTKAHKQFSWHTHFGFLVLTPLGSDSAFVKNQIVKDSYTLFENLTCSRPLIMVKLRFRDESLLLINFDSF